MKEVTRDEFFSAINGQNAHPRILPGPWPYTSVFEYPNRQALGKIEQFYPEGKALTESRYYLTTP